jgi:hypothetical protein
MVVANQDARGIRAIQPPPDERDETHMKIQKMSELPPVISVLFTGDAGAGKTRSSLELLKHCAQNTLAMSGGAGVRAYRAMFPSLGYAHFESSGELLSSLEEMIGSEEIRGEYGALLIDDITMVWQEAVSGASESGIGNDIRMDKQAGLQDIWKQFTRLLAKLHNRNVSVANTVQSKIAWKQHRNERTGRTEWVPDGMKADVSRRIFFGYDLVIDLVKQPDESRIARIVKSRYPTILPEGEDVPNFNVETHVLPCLRTAPVEEEQPEVDPAEVSRMREQIERLLGELMVVEDGPITPALEKRYKKLLGDRNAPAEHLSAGLNHLRELGARAAQAA